MAETQCNLLKNGGSMADNTLFVESITLQGGSTGLNNRSVMYSIATRLSSLLDSLPDGYLCEFVCVNNYAPINNYIFSTTGTSHNANIRTMGENLVNGNVIMTIRVYDTTWGNVNANMLTIGSSGNVTNADVASTIVVQPNTTAIIDTYYKLYKE